ncbi:MAG: tetratricopeptide repeat protein [Nitrospirae bacterium]|nr:tetratricopeptide repeat protein [Nitrospirota bacterium]
MAQEDIEKLKEKVERDPNSTLFVPLAEEYKKADMVDEAIKVLLSGLERHPSYMSARVALGKIYIHKGMTQEAMEEFEKVVKAVPDNLFAHKRLAEIYHSLGERQKAQNECKIILDLNPGDEEVKTLLEGLKEEVGEEKAEKAVEPVLSEVSGEETHAVPSEESAEEKEGAVYEIYEEVSGSELGIEVPEKLTPVNEEPESEELREFKEALRLKSGETIASEEGKKPEVSISTETMADIFISQGLYDRAMGIYRELLSADPQNSKIIQRREELKMLINLAGYKEDTSVSRLTDFLNRIKRRGDEFRENP